jgi:2-polyprenyl-3-methyl-5-hydroxy-6-metoxy-1,4-benzoquinol methylase
MGQAKENLADYRDIVDLASERATVALREMGICISCRGPLEKCDSGLFDTRFGIVGTYDVARCLDCSLEQLFPFPTPAELKKLYESHYNFGGDRRTLYSSFRDWFLSSVLYRLWIRMDGDISFHGRVGKGRLLDIGCNEGRSLKIYAQNGFQVEGLEVNERAAAVAREAGFTVHTCKLNDLDSAAPYDVVVLSNVLEHAVDPREMLLDIRRILKPSGQVWISCPNSRSWLRAAFGSSWINWHVPFHVVQFSVETSTKVLSETGFRAIETRQITPALWTSASLIAKFFAKEGRPTRELRNPILVLSLVLISRLVFFPALWLGNRGGRGDCLLIVATRS